MRILIVTPEQAFATGNHVTADRFCHGLLQRGHSVQVLATPQTPEPLIQACRSFRPDLIHLLHAYRSGAPWLAASICHAIATVVTLTGTDVNGGLDDPLQGPAIRSLFSRIQGIFSQNRLTVAALRQDFPEWARKIHFHPPGIRLGKTPYPLRESLGIAPDVPLFLHPAGLRPVKGNRELLYLMTPLLEKHPQARLVFCGPILDAAYAENFFTELAHIPWALHAGVIPPGAMPAAMLQSTVILNNSLSEGLPNALVEAAALGLPILARNIPGNAALFDGKIDGALYDNADSF
ncbi:MAG: hypothetical protein C0621_11290, partial [Desulfuromonas sp.]